MKELRGMTGTEVSSSKVSSRIQGACSTLGSIAAKTQLVSVFCSIPEAGLVCIHEHRSLSWWKSHDDAKGNQSHR